MMKNILRRKTFTVSDLLTPVGGYVDLTKEEEAHLEETMIETVEDFLNTWMDSWFTEEDTPVDCVLCLGIAYKIANRKNFRG